mmetsp:Transcript_34243/g.54875  ORF Transcript_34243/g.54875 Transcript_34243/m.54875 type:complete len:94 (+) Transcript_34243:554-835(+)
MTRTSKQRRCCFWQILVRNRNNGSSTSARKFPGKVMQAQEPQGLQGIQGSMLRLEFKAARATSDLPQLFQQIADHHSSSKPSQASFAGLYTTH